MENIEIRQIFYDEPTRSVIEPAYIPLDNIDGDKTWYEFWAILQFLVYNELKENVFYGFFSPKFFEKTGHRAYSVLAAVNRDHDKDAILFSYCWDQISYFLNPWEQGEIWHPGITLSTQEFLNRADIKMNLQELVSCQRNFTFSNFIVAKRQYWEAWKSLAIKFLMYADNSCGSLASANTAYRRGKVPMKVFIQERLPAILFAKEIFQTTVVQSCEEIPLSDFFVDNDINRRKILHCNELKNEMLERGPTETTMKEFIQARESVEIRKKFLHVFSEHTKRGKLRSLL